MVGEVRYSMYAPHAPTASFRPAMEMIMVPLSMSAAEAAWRAHVVPDPVY